MLKDALAFGRKCLFSPSAAARAAREPEALPASLLIYAVFLVGYWLFFTFKPFDFPERGTPAPQETIDALYWLKVALWQPPLEAAWIASLLGMLVFFDGGGLALRVAAGAGWWAALLVLIVAYAQLHGISKTAFAAGSLLAFAPFWPLIKRSPPGRARTVLSFMLGTNAIGVALFIPMWLSLWLDSPRLYYAAQIGGGFWILGVGTLGLRDIAALRLPRTFMSLLISMFFQIALPMVLYLLGLVPKDILKALFYG